MRIVLITSGQPSLNPRLVKEADVLSLTGYEVIVLYTYWNNWGTTFDETLLKAKKWKAIRVGGDPKQKPLTYLLSRIMHKLAIAGARKIDLKYFAEFAISRNSYSLMKAAAIANADLYIAHNLGALPAVVKAAKIHGKPCGFDAEDFHRNEVSNDPNNFDVSIKTYIEDIYIPQVNYLTVSSPQISEAYQKLYADKKPVTILNVFPISKKTNQTSINKNGRIKLFWFSQTIGQGRGIENVLEALRKLKNDTFELHLLGQCDKEFKQELCKRSNLIYFHEPVNPNELTQFASQFDIGIAAENASPYNRNICLTNKIFTYMQAGLAIIASNTTAQKILIDQHPTIGKIYENENLPSLTTALQHYSQNRGDLMSAQNASLELAHKKYNWEQESTTFLGAVQNALNIS